MLLVWLALSLTVSVNAQKMDSKSCLQAEPGLKLAIKVQLNALKDPRSQRVDDLKWDKYCECLEARTKDRSNLPPSNILEPQHERAARVQRDTLACINLAGFKKAKQTKLPKLQADPYFSEKVTSCGESGLAQLLIIESSLKSVADPRDVRKENLNLPKYCQCYFDFIRHKAGTKYAKVMAAGDVANIQPSEKSIYLMSVEREGIEYCVAEQIPYPNRAKKKTTALLKKSPDEP